MLIWRNVDQKVLAAILIEAARTYTANRRGQSKGGVSKDREKPPSL